MAKKIAIKVRDLTKSFGSNDVLQGVSFDVQRGSMLALLGRNGAGKTTTVKILSTLLKANSGSVIIEGHDVQKNPDKVRSVIGLTGQSAAIDELLTGRENLVMMGQLYRLTKKSSIKRAEELLEEFDLVDAADRLTKTYSGGMRRRLDLAVSLIATPPIIFLDEPTTGLDPRSRLVMWDIIQKLMDNGTTILLTTQYLEEADQLADKIILINKGVVAAEGTAAQLKRKIGKDQFILTFSSKKHFDAAQEALTDRVTQSNEDELQLLMPIKGTGKDIQKILSILESNKISIESTDIRKPTLDDVFLNITAGGRK